MNMESASIMDPSLDPWRKEDRISQELDLVRSRLAGIEQSMLNTALDECSDPPLNDLRNRTELLERDLHSAWSPSADRVDVQLEDIRQRLERLKKNLSHGLE